MAPLRRSTINRRNNPYIRFLAHYRSEHPGVLPVNIIRDGAAVWRTMSLEQKESFRIVPINLPAVRDSSTQVTFSPNNNDDTAELEVPDTRVNAKKTSRATSGRSRRGASRNRANAKKVSPNTSRRPPRDVSPFCEFQETTTDSDSDAPVTLKRTRRAVVDTSSDSFSDSPTTSKQSRRVVTPIREITAPNVDSDSDSRTTSMQSHRANTPYREVPIIETEEENTSPASFAPLPRCRLGTCAHRENVGENERNAMPETSDASRVGGGSASIDPIVDVIKKSAVTSEDSSDE